MKGVHNTYICVLLLVLSCMWVGCDQSKKNMNKKLTDVTWSSATGGEISQLRFSEDGTVTCRINLSKYTNFSSLSSNSSYEICYKDDSQLPVIFFQYEASCKGFFNGITYPVHCDGVAEVMTQSEAEGQALKLLVEQQVIIYDSYGNEYESYTVSNKMYTYPSIYLSSSGTFFDIL